MKVDLELVKIVMQRNELDVRQISQIIEELHFEASTSVDEDKAPPVKKQFVILVSDPQGEIQKDFVGWVLQIPEEDSPAVTEDRLRRGAIEFNATKKGQRMPVRSIGEICENVPSLVLKGQNVWVKTKEPVLIITTKNKLP